MRILFVAPYLPSPAHFRSFRILQGMAHIGHRITVVALGSNSESDEGARLLLSEFCEAVYHVPHSRGGALVQSALHVATNTPLWAASYFSPAMNATLTRLISERRFDLAHVEHLRVAYVASVLNKRMPTVF